MKKILMLIMVLVMSIGLTACKDESEVQVGPLELDNFSITVPEGWVRNFSDNNFVFTTENYPEEASYIMISTNSDEQVAELLFNKDTVIEQVLLQLEEQLGEEGKAEFESFEEYELNGTRCVRTVVSYYSEGKKVTQEQYSFDTSAGAATFTFALIGDDNFSEDFQKSINSIEIR